MWDPGQAKTYTLVLYNGNINGMVSIANDNGGCVVYSSPRDSVEDLFNTEEAFNKFGVYMLLSPDKIYVGKSSDLKTRISQHKVGKVFWDCVVLFTEASNNLDDTAIKYLEYVLIEKAQNAHGLICLNKKVVIPQKLN